MNTVAAQGCPNSPVREVQNNPLKAIETIAELVEALRGVVRIVEAFSYTNTLGTSQQSRLDAAKAVLAKATT